MKALPMLKARDDEDTCWLVDIPLTKTFMSAVLWCSWAHLWSTVQMNLAKAEREPVLQVNEICRAKQTSQTSERNFTRIKSLVRGNSAHNPTTSRN